MATAFVISGGGARIVQGYSLIKKYLEEGGAMPDYLVGTSAGGLLSILISHCGMEGALEEILAIKSRTDLFDDQLLWGFKRLGMWGHKPLEKKIERITTQYKKTIPYYVCAYDLKVHEKRYLSLDSGPKRLVATACMSFLVNPVSTLVDGGIVENNPLAYPIKRLGCDYINLFSCSAKQAPNTKMPRNKVTLVMRCYEAMQYELARDDVKVCLSRNNDPGFRHINVSFHTPPQNVVDVLDFKNMKKGYEILMSGERSTLIP